MKRIPLFLLLALILTACQPAAVAPTATLDILVRDPLAIKESATAARTTDLAQTAAVPTPFTPPPPTVTEPAPTNTSPPGAEHITGSIELASGLCCAGGDAGTEIEVPVALSAASSAGVVTEMRLAYRYVSGPIDIEAAEWQPHAEQASLPIEVIINWVGLEACVQFRDTADNISEVYCDDVSVEGMPGE